MEMFGTMEQARTDEVALALLLDREDKGHDYVYLSEDGTHWIWEWYEGGCRPHEALRHNIGAILTGEVSIVRHEHPADFELETADIASRAEAMSWTP
jgi:hypothetical protein